MQRCFSTIAPELIEQLQRFSSRYKKLVLGFTTEVPYYMHLADFFVGKPGPGSISEALVMGLPVIVEDNARTMPHERYNVQWIRERQVGVAVKKMRQIASAVSEVLESDNLARFQSNIRTMNNRAILEVPRLFSDILETASASTARLRGRHV